MVATSRESGGSGGEREGFSAQIPPPEIRHGANRKNCRSHCMIAKSDCEENSVLPFSMH